MVEEAVELAELVPLRGVASDAHGRKDSSAVDSCQRWSAHPRAVSVEVQRTGPRQATWAFAHRRSYSAGGR
jgi:hypothetical protein